MGNCAGMPPSFARENGVVRCYARGMTSPRTPISASLRFRLPAAALTLCAALAARAADDDFFEPSPFVQATAAFESKDVARAEALVTPLAEGDGATAEACSLLGQIRMRQKRPAEAVAQFERAVAKSPSSAPMHSRLGEALLAQAAGVGGAECEALLKRARAELERAAGMDAGCIDAQMGLLRYHLMAPAAGPAGAAERYAAAAAKLEPLSATYDVAAMAEAFKRYDLAEPYYREYARLFPNPWLSWKHGCMLVALKRTEEARAVFTAILAAVPGFEQARKSLAALPAQ